MLDRNGIWVAGLAWFLGLAALLCDHFQPSPLLIVSMRTLFGTAVCLAICLVLIPNSKAVDGTVRPELYLLTRTVSRWVYILMYSLAIVRISLYLYETSQHCAPCTGARSAAHPVRPLDDFQFYIVCCVLPLWAVRALVLSTPFRSRTT